MKNSKWNSEIEAWIPLLNPGNKHFFIGSGSQRRIEVAPFIELEEAVFLDFLFWGLMQSNIET